MELIEKCKAEFELLTGITHDSRKPIHVSVVEDMVAYRETQKWNEGIKSMSISGTSETYRDDYPDNVMRILSSLKKRVRIL